MILDDNFEKEKLRSIPRAMESFIGIIADNVFTIPSIKIN